MLQIKDVFFIRYFHKDILTKDIMTWNHFQDTIATHFTFMLTMSSSWSMCKLDTHRLAASTSSISTRTLSSFRIFTVVTFPYRQNKLNTRSQLTISWSSPCTSSTLFGTDGEGRKSGVGNESPLAPTLRGFSLFVSKLVEPPVFASKRVDLSVFVTKRVDPLVFVSERVFVWSTNLWANCYFVYAKRPNRKKTDGEQSNARYMFKLRKSKGRRPESA